MTYFTSSQHASVASNPSNIVALYNAERSRFISNLPASFAGEAEEHRQLAFCSLFAYDHTPYGSGGGLCSDPLIDLLNRSSMDCDNYVAVTWRLFNLLVPNHATRVCAVGWDGGAVGNHAQLVAHKTPDAVGNNGGFLLVDPTIGLYACAYNFDWLVKGKPFSSTYVKSFYSEKNDGIAGFNSTVLSAVLNGQYKPSDIMYTFNDVEKFVNPPPMADWPTPALSGLEY